MQRPSRRSDGTLVRRRERLPWPEGKRFRILAIDGGGIRGILPAAILSAFERRHLGGASVGDCFDLIAGTSTGGIIALGLSLGMPAGEILDLYLRHGSEIFPSASRFRRIRSLLSDVRALGRYRYDRAPLERELRRTFGVTLLGEAQRRLCIPSFDGFTEVNVFKTPHHPDFRLDWREEMVTAALATSAAPTFFSVYRNQERRFSDGGVWANNPVMIALVDTLTCNSVAPECVDILSLGCGEAEMIVSDRQVELGGLWHWRGIISSAMHLSSQNAIGQAGLLVGRDRLIRLDLPPEVGAGAIRLDDAARAAAELPEAAEKLADDLSDVVRKRFLYAPAEPYKAYHGPRARSGAERLA